MDHIDDKSFYKQICRESSEYSNEITEAFPYFCFKIFWDNMSSDDIEDALKGLKKDDESIDGFFVDTENREINFIQCKAIKSLKNKKNNAKKEWLDFHQGIPSKLGNVDYIDQHNNGRLREIAAEYTQYKKKGYEVRLHFFHLGTIDENVRQHFKNIDYFGFEEIKDKYIEHLSKLDKTEPQYIRVTVTENFIEPKVTKSHRSLISVVTGAEVVKLFEEHKFRLFDKNLRFGLGKNKINKGIVETALSEPHNFYFYNNGITITAHGYKRPSSSGVLRIDYPQIINGAQTVNAIYQAYSDRKNKLQREGHDEASDIALDEFNKVKLLFRVITDKSKDGKMTTDFESNVIRYNNTQNAINETDFYANRAEQLELQRLFSRYGYFYECKRGDRKYLENGKETHILLGMKKKDFNRWNEKIDMESLASIWMAYSNDPSLQKTKKSHIFGNIDNYNEVFSAEDIDDELIRKMAFAVNLSTIIKRQTDIYGGAATRGQAHIKVTQYDSMNEEEKVDAYTKLRTIITGSYVFGDVFNKKFETKETFEFSKSPLTARIKQTQFISAGRFMILAAFKKIVDQCSGYEELIIGEHNLCFNNDWIERNIVKPWFHPLITKVMAKEYRDYSENIGGSEKTFYEKESRWKNIQERIEQLPYEEDKEITDIFPLKM